MNLRKYIQISDSKAVVPFEEKDDAELYMNQLAERWFEGMFFLKGYPRPKSPKKTEVALMFERNLKSLIQNYLFPEIKDPKHLKLEQLQKIDEAKAWILANARELISQRSFISFSLNPNEFFTLSVAENLGSRQFTKTVPNENFTLSTSQKFLYLQETEDEVKSSEWKKQEELYTFTETFDLDATLINVPPYSNGKLNPELLTKLYWCEAVGIDYVVNTNRILQTSLKKMLQALNTNHNVEEETLDYSLKCLKDHDLNPRVCTPGDPHTNPDLKYYEEICRNERFVLDKLNRFQNRDEKIKWLENILYPKVDSKFNAEEKELTEELVREKELTEVLTKENEWKAKPGEGWKQPQALLISDIITAERKTLGTITAHFDDDSTNIDGMHTDLLLAPQFIPALVVRTKDEGLNIDCFEQISRLDGLSQFANEDFILRFIENNQKELKHPSVDKKAQLKELAAIQYFIQMNPVHHLLPNLLKAFYKNKYKHLNKNQQESFNELVAVKVLNLYECKSRKEFLNKRNIESVICKKVAKKIALMKPSKTLHSSASGSNLKPRPRIQIQRSASVRDIRHKPEIKISSRAQVSTNRLFSQVSPSSKTKLTDILRLPNKPHLKDFKQKRYGRSFQKSEPGDLFRQLLANENLKPTVALEIDPSSDEYNQLKMKISKFDSFENLIDGLSIDFENADIWVTTLAQIYQIAFDYLSENVQVRPSSELSAYFTENGDNLLKNALLAHPAERLQAAMLTSILEIVSESLVKFHKSYAELLMKLIQRQNTIIMDCRDCLDDLIKVKVAEPLLPELQRIYEEINQYLISLLRNPAEYKQISYLTKVISNIRVHAIKGDIDFLKSFNAEAIGKSVTDSISSQIKTDKRLEELGVNKKAYKQKERLNSKQLQPILTSEHSTSSITQRVSPKFIRPAIAATASTVVGGTSVTYTFLTAGALVAAQQVIPVWGQIVAAVFLAVGVGSLLTMGVLKCLSWNSERRRKNSEKAVQQTLSGQKDEVTPAQINKNGLTRNATMSQKLRVEKAPDVRPQPVPVFSPNSVVAQADPSRVSGLEEGYSAQSFSNETARQIRL